MRRQFKIAKHEEYDYVGLAPTWMSDHQSDPLMGMGVAHDILEHGPRDTVEWQGLGGAVWVRGTQGYFQQGRGNPDPVENIASDFVQLYHLWGGEDIPDPGVTRSVGDDDEMIQDVVRAGCRLVREEINGNGPESDANVRDWTREEQQRSMIGWMRRGYRACTKRWAKHSPYMVMETFRAIEEAVDRFLKEHEVYIGAEAVITFDLQSASADIRLTEEWEDGR